MDINEFYGQSGHELIQQLGRRFASYRKQVRMTQKDLSIQSGISVFTISTFENGSQTGLTLSTLLKLLRGIGFLEEIDKLLPELPESPRAQFYAKHRNSRSTS